jgi:hypothetical protein
VAKTAGVRGGALMAAPGSAQGAGAGEGFSASVSAVADDSSVPEASWAAGASVLARGSPGPKRSAVAVAVAVAKAVALPFPVVGAAVTGSAAARGCAYGAIHEVTCGDAARGASSGGRSSTPVRLDADGSGKSRSGRGGTSSGMSVLSSLIVTGALTLIRAGRRRP